MMLILWSGGCDSTLILQDALTAKIGDDGLRHGSLVTVKPTEPIRALSIDHPQTCGIDGMLNAQKQLYPLLRKMAKWVEFSWGTTTIRYVDNVINLETSGRGIIQPCVWLPTAQICLRRDEDLYAGYIRGDDIWHHFDEVRKLFDAMQSLSGKTGRLICPLEWWHKSEVISSLDRKLLSKVWYCEKDYETKRPCGECDSCKTHAMGLRRIEFEETPVSKRKVSRK